MTKGTIIFKAVLHLHALLAQHGRDPCWRSHVKRLSLTKLVVAAFYWISLREYWV